MNTALLLPFARRVNPMAYTNVARTTIGAALYAYWPLADPAGSALASEETDAPRTGGYGNVTNGVPGIGDGRTATSFNGTTSYCTVYGTSLAAAFPSAEGSISAWVKTSAWTDAVLRRFIIFSVNTNNRVSFSVSATANQLLMSYVAGGVSKTFTLAETRATWLHVALTWSVIADQFIGYINGVAVGAPLTGLGVWTGSLSSAACLIGAANNSGANVLSGQMAHVTLCSVPLTAAQVAVIATPPVPVLG